MTEGGGEAVDIMHDEMDEVLDMQVEAFTDFVLSIND